jgi:hypothetical protein
VAGFATKSKIKSINSAEPSKTNEVWCWNSLPNKAAQQIDTSYDDGTATTGSMRGSGNYTAAMTGAVPTPDAVAAVWSCMSN